MTVRQRLSIEEAKLWIECSWPSGVKIRLESFIPPKPNVLVVRWNVEHWNAATKMCLRPPVWFSLHRWADPPLAEFAARFFADCRHGAFIDMASPKVTPLAPPTTKQVGNLWGIEQTFPPDPTFPKGFSYWMVPFTSGVSVELVDMRAVGEARLHLMTNENAPSGEMAVAVATTGDAGGPAEPIQAIRGALGDKPAVAIARWEDENRKAAAEFWSRSKVSIADPLLENLWYETFHARRCVTAAGKVPPGLFLPSTVRDYSHWHADYHWNYNFEQPYWGDYAANHLDLGDAYFVALDFALRSGRKIAKDYYGCRGAFIQLSTYPILAEDDTLGAVPMGRMAYMTGWAMSHCWWRYRYTLDKQWLRSTGYPAIRDGALFYGDLMKKRADGLYHIFPSNSGEDGFTGNAKDYTDRAQVMQQARHCLQMAVLASEALDADADLRAAWRDRFEHAAGDDGRPPLVLSGLAKERYEANPPEFGLATPVNNYRPEAGKGPLPELGWYFGQYPISMLGVLHRGEFVVERDFPIFRRLASAWRRPNGLYWAMTVAGYGRAGAWTESLGVAAPLQEMMLQSWDGALRVFPSWPEKVDARFDDFRAEGAFLVSAAWSRGNVAALSIRSLRGAPCRVYSPWPKGFSVVDASGGKIAVANDAYGRPEFATQAGGFYHLISQ
jgi:hypothetical protein